MLLGLGGSKGSGKSTIAQSICKTNPDIFILSFGEHLKRMLYTTFKLNPDWFYKEEYKEQKLFNINLNQVNVKGLLDYANSQLLQLNTYEYRSGMGFERTELKTPRQLMQVVGSEIFRDRIDTHYWVKCFNLLSLKGLQTDVNVIIDDVRFQNEIDFIKSKGGKIVFIDRNLPKLDLHQSEMSDIVKLSSDTVIINTSLDDSVYKVNKLLE